MASLALGWIGEPALARLLEAPLHGLVSDALRHTISFITAFTIITFLHIVLGELAPKTLALERAERVALAIAWPMQAVPPDFPLADPAAGLGRVEYGQAAWPSSHG